MSSPNPRKAQIQSIALPRSVSPPGELGMAPKTAKDPLKAWRKDADTLSYEEALQAADLLLQQLQNDNTPLAELQQTYQRGQIYLERCESLLQAVEQSVLELDPDTMTTTVLDKTTDD